MSVTENDMKQPANADATEMWPEVTKGESDGAFSAKANRL